MRAWLALLLAVVLPGCLPGEERFFFDESEKVQGLRVNAYAKEGPAADAIVETRGIGSSNGSHAFAGRLTFLLERQEGTTEPNYTEVRRWSVDVTADDFSSPTYPYHEHVIAASTLGTPATYRVTVSAAVGGRELAPASALFAWPHR